MKRYRFKKLLFGLMALFCLLLVAYKLFFYFDKESEIKAVAKNRQYTRLNTQELALIREGDFILRRGFGFFSDYVATKLNSGTVDVTHAGIVIKKDDRWQVVHALSSDVSDTDGVQVQSLNDFLAHSQPGKIIITRAKGTTAAFGNRVAAKAQSYLNCNIPFDHEGNYDDDSELFCTELIWKILEKDLMHSKLPRQKEQRKQFFYSMMPMYNTKYFDIIINQHTQK